MIPGMACFVDLTPFSKDGRSRPFALRSRNVPIEQRSPASGEWFNDVAAYPGSGAELGGVGVGPGGDAEGRRSVDELPLKT
jgi:hypothetical protein